MVANELIDPIESPHLDRGEVAAYTTSETAKVQKIIDGKIAIGQSIISAAMTWWVSSVVFCASVVAATWLRRADVHALSFAVRALFCGVVLVFFVSVVAFGVLTYRTFRRLAREVGELRTSLGTADKGKIERAWEFDFAATATGVGTTSFLLITLIWFGISVQLLR
jgi:hypothetical protein